MASAKASTVPYTTNASLYTPLRRWLKRASCLNVFAGHIMKNVFIVGWAASPQLSLWPASSQTSQTPLDPNILLALKPGCTSQGLCADIFDEVREDVVSSTVSNVCDSAVADDMLV